MPVHENLRKTGDPLDLVQESFKKGIAGRSGGPVEAATTVVKESSGNAGALGGADQDQITPLGVSNISPPTGVSAASTATAGELSVTYTPPTGITTVEIVVHTDQADVADAVGQRFDVFVKKVDATGSPHVVTGLSSGVAHRAFVRGVDSDGRVGRAASAVGTPT